MITRSSLLESHNDRIVQGFSTRIGGVSTVYRDGDLNLGFTEHDDRANVEENRRRFVAELPGTWQLCTISQKHTADISLLDAPQPCTGDGLITQTPDLLLAILTADCVPVLLYDPATQSIGAFHAGWRGTVQRIVEHGVAKMHTAFGTDPANIVAAIGPSIGPASYQVGDEVYREFTTHFSYGAELFRNIHLNLWEANRRQLLDAGVPEGNIQIIGHNTAAQTDLYFSHRAEKGRTGRMMSVIGLQP